MVPLAEALSTSQGPAEAQPGQLLTARPWAVLGGVGVVEESKRLLDKEVGRGLPELAGALAVEDNGNLDIS
jgi:hypothetical protein